MGARPPNRRQQLQNENMFFVSALIKLFFFCSSHVIKWPFPRFESGISNEATQVVRIITQQTKQVDYYTNMYI
jgi:hypothetical protein